MTILEVLVSLMVFGTNGSGAIGAKSLVTVTTTLLPGWLSGSQVASTVTGTPTVLLWTKLWMSALDAAEPLAPPRTAAQRTPSLALADTTLYAKISRPASTIPNARTRKSTRAIGSSVSDWPACARSRPLPVVSFAISLHPHGCFSIEVGPAGKPRIGEERREDLV